MLAGLVADYTYVARSRLRWWRYGPKPPVPLDGAEGLAPVLLIPGVFETWHYLKPLHDALRARGHAVHAVPELGFNRHPIAEMAAMLAAYVEHRDLRDIVIVAHSKGGLIGTLLLRDDELAVAEGAARRFSHMISLNTPYAGSPLSRYAIGPWREFRPTLPVIAEVGAARAAHARTHVLRSAYDQYVPVESALLTGAAENVELPHVGHFRLLGLPSVIDEVLARVTPRAT